MTTTGTHHRLLALILCVFAVLSCPALAEQETLDAATRKLMRAGNHFDRGDYEFAAEEYEEFLEHYADHEGALEARYGLAISHYRRRQYSEAAEELRKVLDNRDFERRSEALAVLGHCLLADNENEAARVVFQRILDDHGDSPHVEHAALGRIQTLYRLGMHKECVEAADAFGRQHAESNARPIVGYIGALSRFELEDYANAAEALMGFTENYPNSPYFLDATLLLAQSLQHTGAAAEAAELLTEQLDSAPSARQAELRYSLGVALYDAEEYDDAAERLKQVLDDYEDSEYVAPARLHLGLTQLAAGETDDARGTLSEVVDKDEGRRDQARYWIAQCHIDDDNHAEAFDILDALANQDDVPKAEAVRFDRAMCLADLERYDEAAEAFKAFREEYPESDQADEAAYRQAWSLHRQGEHQASYDLRDTVEEDSEFARPFAELNAENLFRLSKYEEAEEILAALAEDETDPDKARQHAFLRGQCAYFMDDYERAAEHLGPLAEDEVVGEDPVLRTAIFFLADSHFQQQKPAEAVEAFRQYLSAAGDEAASSDEARYKLAMAYLQKERDDDAAEHLDKLRGRPADSPWVGRGLYERGQMLQEAEQYEEADAVLAQLLEANPSANLAAPARYLYAWVAMDAGSPADAAERFEALASAHEEHPLAEDAAYQKGIALFVADETEDALAAFRDYMDKYEQGPHARDARQMIGTSLARLGRHEQAAEELAKLAEREDEATAETFYVLAASERQRAAEADDDDADKKRERIDASIAAYRKLLERFEDHPLAPNARAELAELLYDIEKYDEVAGVLEPLLADEQTPDALKPAARYRLGWARVRQDEHEKAADALAAFAENNPEHDLTPSALYQAGLSRIAHGEPSRAVGPLNTIVENHRGHDLHAQAMLKLGQAQATIDEFGDSEKTYAAFLDRHQDSEFVYLAQFGRGWALQNQRKYDEARSWYQRVVDTHNGETAARAQFQIGQCYFSEGNYERAMRELSAVTSVFAAPKWASKGLFEAGRAAEQLQQYSRARSYYDECIREYEDTNAAALSAQRLEDLPG